MKNGEKKGTRRILLNPGDILRSCDAEYHIMRQLNSQNGSRVYVAKDINNFNKHYLIKEFAPQLKKESDLKKAHQLFEREAGIFYRLEHSQISQFQLMLCYKRENEAYLFLVRDFVEGTTYSSLLARQIQLNGKFGEEEIKQLLSDILPVLEYIHSMGVIHRNISPDNIILRHKDRKPVLIDFGDLKRIENECGRLISESNRQIAISNAQSDSDDSAETAISTLQPPNAVAKTQANYAPPEQMERRTAYAHSDLYALAATMVVLLTGKQPQQLIDLDTHRWHWRNTLNFSANYTVDSSAISEVCVSSKLEWILSTMLSPNPGDRFGSAVEISQILQEMSASTIQIDRDSEDLGITETSSNKNSFIVNLLTESLFVISFFMVLLWGGYLYLKILDIGINPNSVQTSALIGDRLNIYSHSKEFKQLIM